MILSDVFSVTLYKTHIKEIYNHVNYDSTGGIKDKINGRWPGLYYL